MASPNRMLLPAPGRDSGAMFNSKTPLLPQLQYYLAAIFGFMRFGDAYPYQSNLGLITSGFRGPSVNPIFRHLGQPSVSLLVGVSCRMNHLSNACRSIADNWRKFPQRFEGRQLPFSSPVLSGTLDRFEINH